MSRVVDSGNGRYGFENKGVTKFRRVVLNDARLGIYSHGQINRKSLAIGLEVMMLWFFTLRCT